MKRRAKEVFHKEPEHGNWEFGIVCLNKILFLNNNDVREILSVFFGIKRRFNKNLKALCL